jgi:uncharacterized protein YdaU (DUF1376 family)
MDWYPWFPLAFRRDTYSLSLAEEGAYRRLIDEYMLNRKGLPDDDTALARILGVALADWLLVAVPVRAFFRPRDGMLIHKRCDAELRAQDTRMARLSARGKNAAFQRWNKNNAQHARRMHAHATLHNNRSSSIEPPEKVEAPKVADQTKKKWQASPELERLVLAK